MGNVNVHGAANVTSVNGVAGPVRLGGRNLLPDSTAPSLAKVAGKAARYFSNAGNAAAVKCSFVALDDPPVPGITYGVQTTITAVSYYRGLCWYAEENVVHLIDGETYTISCYARVLDGTTGIQFQVGYGVPYYTLDIRSIDNKTWKQYSYTFKYDASDWPDSPEGIRIYMPCGGGSLGTVQTCGFQLERGTVATDWTLSVEDIFARLAALEAAVGITADPPEIDGPDIMDDPADTAGGVIFLDRCASERRWAA